MVDVAQLVTSAKREAEGVWEDLGDGRICVASTEQDGFIQQYEEVQEKFRAIKRVTGESPDGQQVQDAVAPIVAEWLVKGWEGFTLGDEPFPYTRENAVKLMKISRPLMERVLEIAKRSANYRDDADRGAILKNLRGSSCGPTPTEDEKSGSQK